MTLIDFIQRLLGRDKPSGALARERLQLVLAHDRSDLNPELLEQMRREILEVVQKYVEIDLESGDVSLETGDRVTALVANLPIRRAKPLAIPRTASDSVAAGPVAEPTATAGAEGPRTDPDGVDAEKAAVADPRIPG
jgi:cell division topological specificity factor